MSSSKFMRLGGLAAFIGGVLLLMASLLPPALVAASSGYIPPLAEVVANTGEMLGLLLLLPGLFGLYSRQSGASGALGLIGFLAAFLATAMVAFLATAMALVRVESAPPTWLVLVVVSTFGLGWLLFGVATLRARVHPRAAVWLLLIGIIGDTIISWVLVAAVNLDLGIPGLMFIQSGFEVLFAVAVSWLGFLVFAQEDEELPHQTVARVRHSLYGILLAIVGLSGNPDDERDNQEGPEPDTTSGT